MIVRGYEPTDYEQLKALYLDIDTFGGQFDEAIAILKARGHSQVLVYTSVGNSDLDSRYDQLGFIRGGDYTCFWKEI